MSSRRDQHDLAMRVRNYVQTNHEEVIVRG
jgi:hypothetical protein